MDERRVLGQVYLGHRMFIDRNILRILDVGVKYSFDDLTKEYDTSYNRIVISKLSSSGELEAVTLKIDSVSVGDYVISKHRETTLTLPIYLYKYQILEFQGDTKEKVIISFNVRLQG